jgi:hypothetical protein
MVFRSCKKLHNIISTNFIVVLLSLNFSAVNAQFSDKEFFSRLDTNYFSLEAAKLSNFSTWVTSNVFRENTKDLFEEEVSPLELIWSYPDKMYFIKRPLPAGKTDSQYAMIDTLQIMLQSELKGIFYNWQRFIGEKLLLDKPQNYLFTTSNDSVFLEFDKLEDSRNLHVSYVFGLNALCLKIALSYEDSKEIIYTYPKYIYVDSRWLCNEWRVQIENEGVITSGILVKINSHKIKEFWLPHKIFMFIQTAEEPGKAFIREFYFKNILLNRDIQVIN